MPLTNIASRSTDPQKLTAYQTSKSERPVIRPYIPADKVSWDASFNEYSPVNYTSPIVLSNPSWADPVNPK
jgi:hypothetical protein